MSDVITKLSFAALFSALTACSSAADGPPDGQNGAVSTGGPMPCEIETIVKSRCQMCHGPTPIGGAPMSLTSASDFQRDYQVRMTQPLLGQTVKLYDLVMIRINGDMGTPKMPQGSPLAPNDYALLTSWLQAGAPGGLACGAPPPPGAGGYVNNPGAGGYVNNPGAGGWVNPGAGGYVNPGAGGWVNPGAGGYVNPGAGGYVNPGTGGATTTGADIITPNSPDQCANDPTQFQPLVARPGETCYEFRVHGSNGTQDTSKFAVAPGQSYNQFYYDVPWPAGTVATRFGAKFDNLGVLHHWLAFGSNANVAAGTVQRNVTGTTLGEGAELIGGWAVGGCNVEFGPEMGLKLPDHGKIMIQWHHYNSTGANAPDGTVVQFCTVPQNARPNVGGLTFLGTENFNGLLGMPAGKQSEFSGTCTNNSGKPITILGWNPHMHLLGTNMRSVVTHPNGSTETVFDHPFLFDHQVNYLLSKGYVLNPGDKITSTCTFNNTTPAPVAFGQSTTAEMCYQFTFAYPYDALNNHVISLIGATNTCW